MAAGHRPCAYCQRARFGLFRETWAAANPELAGDRLPPAPQLDAALHQERITATGQKVTYPEKLGNLPTGAFVTLAQFQQPLLVFHDALLPWQPSGYGSPIQYADDPIGEVLTPRSVVRALARGYPAELHPSASR